MSSAQGRLLRPPSFQTMMLSVRVSFSSSSFSNLTLRPSGRIFLNRILIKNTRRESAT